MRTFKIHSKNLVSWSIIVFSLAFVVAHGQVFEPRIDTILYIVDGDTFRVNLNTEDDYCEYVVCERAYIRVRNINAEEYKPKGTRRKKACSEQNRKNNQVACAEADRLEKILRGATHVELKNVISGMYFRLVSDVYVDGKKFEPLRGADDAYR